MNMLYVKVVNHGIVVTQQLFRTKKLFDTTIPCTQKLFTNNLSPTEKLSRKSCKSRNSCITQPGIVVHCDNYSVHKKVVKKNYNYYVGTSFP